MSHIFSSFLSLHILFSFLLYLSLFRSNDCNESQGYLAPVTNENTDITFDPTGSIIEGDINDHIKIEESFQRYE